MLTRRGERGERCAEHAWRSARHGRRTTVRKRQTGEASRGGLARGHAYHRYVCYGDMLCASNATSIASGVTFIARADDHYCRERGRRCGQRVNTAITIARGGYRRRLAQRRNVVLSLCGRRRARCHTTTYDSMFAATKNGCVMARDVRQRRRS